MRLARELADRIVALEYENLPAAACYGSRIAVLDTLAGSREAAPQIVEDVLLGTQPSQGPCLIFGTFRRASALEAKFSVQYCVARALLDGEVTLEHFEGDAYAEARVRDLLTRVHAIPYAGPLADPSDPFDCEVRVTTTDGKTVAANVVRPHGRTADDPIPFEQLQAKFEQCARLVISAESAAAASRMIAGLDSLASVRDLTQLLEPVRQVEVSSLAHA